MAFDPLELIGGIAIGTGVGAAVGDVVIPQLETLRQDQWAKHAVRLPAAGTLAQGVAQGQIDPGLAATWAKRGGFDQAQFDALVNIANVGPGSAYAFELWRRGVIGESGFRRAVQRLGLEQEWIDDLVRIVNVLLTPAELAVMVQRGIVANDGLLPVGPPQQVGRVPPMPSISIDPIAEAAGSGVDRERLAGLARIIGLPASPDLAARMVYRNIIERVDFDRAISEGNTRNEWAPFLFEGFREIPTSHDYIEARLRGWINDAAMYAGTAKHGLSHADTDLRFKVLGRPLSFHQVFIGERRGGTYDGSTAQIDPAFLKSLEESNVRPEWYNLAWAQRYSYPTAFVLRSLTEAGDLTQKEAHDILLFEGWEPSLAQKVSARWAGATGTGTGAAASKPNPWVAKADNHLWTAVQKGYIGGAVDQANATRSLNLIGVPHAAQQLVFARWDETKRIEAL